VGIGAVSAQGATPTRLSGRTRGGPARLVSAQDAAAANRRLTPDQKLLLLDTWAKSGLSANDFSALCGVNKITLYSWKKRFEELGPAGLAAPPRKGSNGSKAPELTKRTILMLKQAHPEWGCQRISDVLYRGPGLPASANTVSRILHEAGYVLEESPTSPHPDKVRSFERAAPNELWQTDLFTFILKRQNRRVYLVAFMDDHSRYIVGYALHASCTSPLVIEAFRAAVAGAGAPKEVLTDNGPQYVTWRGTSKFAAELQKRGIRHIVATPRRPQTLGKVERFWGTLWRECLDAAVFIDLTDAQKRVGHFIDYYNFQRPHQGVEGLTPADRFFGAAPQVLAALKARVNANALELARSGTPKAPFYMAGQVGGKQFSLHAEGERVFMIGDDGQRKEVDLGSVPAAGGVGVPIADASGQSGAVKDVPDPVAAQGFVHDLTDEHEAELPPGVSPLDQGLRDLADEFGAGAAPPPSQPGSLDGGEA
jgi:transposase InsO family protein